MAPEQLSTIVARFQNGELEAANDMTCPICGGTVHTKASMANSG
jgi:C4-type Zn-finger protein